MNPPIKALPDNKDVRIRADIEYSSRGDGPLTGDLYLPAAAGAPAPLVIALHGGGWQAGDKAAFRHWGRRLAAAGFGVFAVRYRLVRKGEKAYPGALEDVRSALTFVRTEGLVVLGVVLVLLAIACWRR